MEVGFALAFIFADDWLVMDIDRCAFVVEVRVASVYGSGANVGDRVDEVLACVSRNHFCLLSLGHGQQVLDRGWLMFFHPGGHGGRTATPCTFWPRDP